LRLTKQSKNKVPFFLFLPQKEAFIPFLSFFFLLLLQKIATNTWQVFGRACVIARKRAHENQLQFFLSHKNLTHSLLEKIAVRSFRGLQPHRSNLDCAFKKFSFYLFCFLLHFVINEIELDVKYLALNKIS
jgi:hypothetical protein